MVMMILADGKVDEKEKIMMKGIYQKITNSELSDSDIEKEIENSKTTIFGLEDLLTESIESLYSNFMNIIIGTWNHSLLTLKINLNRKDNYSIIRYHLEGFPYDDEKNKILIEPKGPSYITTIDDKLFFINQDNMLLCIDIENGIKIWDLRNFQDFGIFAGAHIARTENSENPHF